MIIFDLDGTLADCEHRRHFLEKPWDHCKECYDLLINHNPLNDSDYPNCECGRNPFTWKEDWKSFFESCDKDKPIIPSIQLFYLLYNEGICPITKIKIKDVEIWSGRCESVRRKTLMWLHYHINPTFNYSHKVKMRPIGDNTPDEILKERWLDEALSQGKKIDFVFDDRPKVVRMWRRRGIFVFDCNQSGKEF